MSIQPFIPDGKPLQAAINSGRSAASLVQPLQVQLNSSPAAQTRLAANSGVSVLHLSPAARAHAQLVAQPATGRLGWPSAGLSGQLQLQAAQLLQALLPETPARSGQLRPVSAQVWSPSFLAQWMSDRDAPGATSLPLLTWVTQQVQVQVPTGQHALFMRLMLPVHRLPLATPTHAPIAGNGQFSGTNKQVVPAVLRWTNNPLAAAGALAWLLDMDGEATLSALLLLEWGPRRESVVYSRSSPRTADDPWLLQAQLLAMGLKERLDQAERNATWCDLPVCPYFGQAVCPQPFCPATGAVADVAKI